MKVLKKMKTTKDKKRYSIPARLLELLYTDDLFYNEVMKIKRAPSEIKFPKHDEWRDEAGFNISFALAGYSHDDVFVSIEDHTLTVRGSGMDSLNAADTTVTEEDSFEYNAKEGRPRIHVGAISRGIARRKFSVKYLISEDFDTLRAEAKMEHGLLHIKIPVAETVEREIKIRSDADESN